jgi:hypothetical protein
MKFLIDTNVFIPLEPDVGLTMDKWTSAAIAFSRAATGNPKSAGLFEHEYGKPVSADEWKETAELVASCLRTFYRSAVFQRICGLPTERWLDVEDFSSFLLDGVKIHVVLDFSFRDEEGGIVIYDWKTGRSDSERNEVQLACYSFYATEKWGGNGGAHHLHRVQPEKRPGVPLPVARQGARLHPAVHRSVDQGHEATAGR